MTISFQAAQKALAGIKPGWDLRGFQQLSPRAARLELLAEGGAPQQLILLGHSPRDRRRNPDIARDEFALLSSLSRAGLPVPRPLLVETDAEIPFLITEYVGGDTPFAPADLPVFCPQLARILKQIHSIDIGEHDLSFLPAQRKLIAEQIGKREDDAYGIRAAMRAALPRLRFNSPVLLHGDFWPGNLLWRDDQLAAIIDWEDAMLGDPLGDLGKSRLEMLWALGEQAMRLYTIAYKAQNPGLEYGCLPFWDLFGALRLPHFVDWTADLDKRVRMAARYKWFITEALAALERLQE